MSVNFKKDAAKKTFLAFKDLRNICVATPQHESPHRTSYENEYKSLSKNGIIETKICAKDFCSSRAVDFAKGTLSDLELRLKENGFDAKIEVRENVSGLKREALDKEILLTARIPENYVSAAALKQVSRDAKVVFLTDELAEQLRIAMDFPGPNKPLFERGNVKNFLGYVGEKIGESFAEHGPERKGLVIDRIITNAIEQARPSPCPKG